MIELAGKRAWVVGASSGIGAAVARALVDAGCVVAVSARRASALEVASGGRMVTVSADISDAAGIRAAGDAVVEALGGLDIVIMAAGYWQRMEPDTFDRDEFVRHIHANVVGMANCIDAALPHLGEGGMLVGIASVAGYRGMPGAQGYGASKAAQLNLLESLRVGLRAKGVRVISVAPGFVRTPMTETNTFPMPFIISAERAAEHIVKGLRRGRAEIVFPLPMMVAMKVARVVPQSWWPRLFGRA